MPKPKKDAQKPQGTTPAPKGAKPEPGKRELTEMQKRFCEYIAQGKSQTEALILAGSKSKSPEVEASKMLRVPKVAAYLASLPERIRETQEQEEDRRGRIATAAERQEILTSILRGQDKATFVLGFDTGKDTPTHADKLRAADMLAKMNGEYTLNINMKVTAYTQEWLEDLFTLLDEYLPEQKVEEIASRIRKFNP